MPVPERQIPCASGPRWFRATTMLSSSEPTGAGPMTATIPHIEKSLSPIGRRPGSGVHDRYLGRPLPSVDAMSESLRQKIAFPASARSNGCIIVGEVAQSHDGSLGLAHAFIDAI